MKTPEKEIYWSQFAQDFEEKQSYAAGNEVILETLKELGNEKALGDVLELGCGTGLYTEKLVQNSNNIRGTDFSDEMIEVAKHKRGHLEGVIFEKANALDLQYKNESFDTVFMANLIHIIGNSDRTITESKRVLKKGGKVIITSFAVDEMSFFNKISLVFRFLKAFGKPSKEAAQEKTTQQSIENLLTKHGFTIIKSKVLGGKMKAIYICGNLKK